MNSGIQIFSKDEFSIRTLEEDGEIWFVAKDIAQALDYPKSSINQVNNLFANVPEIWTAHKRIMTTSDKPTARPYQEVLCINEQGLYFFLGRSDKPKAIPYQIWVAGEVIPSIRATGKYAANNNTQDMLPNNAIKEAQVIFEAVGITGNQLGLALDKLYRSYTGRSALMAAGIELEAPVKEQALTPTQIAEELGIGKGKAGARFVNQLLKNAGYQRRIAGQWEPTELGKPYALVIDTNKKNSNGTPIIQVKWYTRINDIVKKLAQNSDT